MSEVKIHGLSAEDEAYRAALVAIQELHKPSCVGSKAIARGVTAYCAECGKIAPCPTLRLADDALTARTTKNGDNK